ncbi:MAG: membrane protein insertase YidC [Verrucomicrobiota bacterium]|nr:membrane protein insertase YidC [Verrucomicrobiota bacterium]
MDRQAWIAVTLCVIGLVLWQIYMTTHPAPPMRANASPTPAAPVAESSPINPPPSGVVSPAPSATPQLAETTSSFKEKTEILRNADAELRLTNRGGGISEVVLLNHAAENGRRVVLNAKDRTPIGAIVNQPATATLPEFAMARQADGSVQFERKTPEQIALRKKFFFAPNSERKDNFVAEMDLDFRNDGTQVYDNPDYFITLGSARPIHPNDIPTYTHLTWCISGKAKSIDVSWFAAQNSFFGLQKRSAREFYQEKLPAAEWMGVSNQFFATLLVPLNSKANGAWGRRFEISQPDAPSLPAIEGAMGMPGFQLKPGETSTLRFELYAGPKLYHRLAQLEHNEAEIMDFGILKIVSQALLNLMNLLHQFLGNYAAAIFALTTIVKLTLWPLQNKANRSMRRMSVLSPKMQELREKYKDDPTRMNQEVMKLYKEYGVNPVSGCLPMLIQIPIFFGLFTMLRQAVELRNASFLWVRDLSQPDTIGHLPVLGWPINILPLIMAATNVWMMRITPKSGDATQQRVMMFTPIIFVVFCYNFAAALALYYTTQNLFTILQLYQNRRQPMPTLEKVTPPGKKSRKGR